MGSAGPYDGGSEAGGRPPQESGSQPSREPASCPGDLQAAVLGTSATRIPLDPSFP